MVEFNKEQNSLTLSIFPGKSAFSDNPGKVDGELKAYKTSYELCDHHMQTNMSSSSSLKGSYGYITFSPDGNKAIKRASMQDSNNLNEAIIAASVLNSSSKKRKMGLISYDTVTTDRNAQELCLTMDRGQKTLEAYVQCTRYKYRMANIERIFRDLVTGLHTLHESGFIHCDFKPGNAVMMADGSIEIIDFGSSRQFKRIKSPNDIEIWCTYPFCPPEALMASRDASCLGPSIDAYSLGATMFYYIYKGCLYDCHTYMWREDALEQHQSGVVNRVLQNLICPPACPDYIFQAMLGLLKGDYKARTSIAGLYLMYGTHYTHPLYEPIIIDPKTPLAPSPKRAEAIDFLYDNSGRKECFSLAVNIMDRYEVVKGFQCTFGELIICRDLSIMVMYPDIEIHHTKKQKKTLNTILDALEYKVFVDTADSMIGVDAIDYGVLKKALVDSGGATMDAVTLYWMMV